MNSYYDWGFEKPPHTKSSKHKQTFLGKQLNYHKSYTSGHRISHRNHSGLVLGMNQSNRFLK
uniref:Secreted protein n=1 Tax=Phakopsora pachyrhizi TaxID=170000 RepID=A0A0S1MJ92_PHAPC